MYRCVRTSTTTLCAYANSFSETLKFTQLIEDILAYGLPQKRSPALPLNSTVQNTSLILMKPHNSKQSQKLWALSAKHASRRPSGAENLEVKLVGPCSTGSGHTECPRSACNAARQFLMYSLMMNLFGSKHEEVIKKIQCFSGLPVAFTSARAGVYIHILVTNKKKSFQSSLQAVLFEHVTHNNQGVRHSRYLSAGIFSKRPNPRAPRL